MLGSHSPYLMHSKRSTIQFYCILGSYIGCSLFLMAAFITIHDLFDEMEEFRETIYGDLFISAKYASEARRTMAIRPKMTERAVFDAIIRLKQRVNNMDCEISHQ